MDTRRGTGPHDALLPDPDTVPEHAVCVMKRGLLRFADRIAADPMGDYAARLLVVRMMAALREPEAH